MFTLLCWSVVDIVVTPRAGRPGLRARASAPGCSASALRRPTHAADPTRSAEARRRLCSRGHSQNSTQLPHGLCTLRNRQCSRQLCAGRGVLQHLERMRGLKWKQAMAVATQKAMGPLRMSAAVMDWSCRNSSTRPFLKFACTEITHVRKTRRCDKEYSSVVMQCDDGQTMPGLHTQRLARQGMRQCPYICSLWLAKVCGCRTAMCNGTQGSPEAWAPGRLQPPA